MASDDESIRPLLWSFSGFRENRRPTPIRRQLSQSRTSLKDILASRRKHYAVLALVSLDVATLMANIFVELVACDMKRDDEPWVKNTRQGLTLAGLVFSCVFLVELVLCVMAFGWRYFTDWFHVLDGTVIVASFVVDVLSHGIVEEIASLVIVFRLFRFVKLVEEVSMGAVERMEGLEEQLVALKRENGEMKRQLARR
ncbi:von Willebrand factor A domain-containing protein 5A [Colletotrichum spaethianum]|uniref:Voltage-gated hydrogen channel 1 n=1 Tax=Colletotrichum spaethianum TaxID=700344 RepID=A0AA37PHR6_9PEZI|nr:von Willebrand factor A domain-containing protein 5A [Colletotrichum spaethianum]GKT52541.1 von Willebrand factor A domain-containing protein 5A [Colletotrichum spaethianum]